METLGTRMDGVKGFATGFDYLRIGLSLAVLAWHSYGYTHGIEASSVLADKWAAWLTLPVLPMFFALSGFLVTSSLERTGNIGIFMWHRAVRIVPALAVEVFLSALILGPFLSSLRDGLHNPLTRVAGH
ncbi:MAG: acyltransferase family protein [Burkholderiales bacterium]